MPFPRHLLQAPDPDPSGGGGGGGDLDALKKQLDAANAALAKHAAAEAEAKKKADDAAAAELKRAQEAGETNKVIEAQKKRLAELEALVPDAEFGRAAKAARLAELEEAKKALPADQLAEIDEVAESGGVELAMKMLARMKAAVPANPGARTSAPGGTPPPVDAPDFDKLATEDPNGFRAAVKKYPREWESHKEKLRGPQTRQPTINERVAQARAPLTLVDPKKSAG